MKYIVITATKTDEGCDETRMRFPFLFPNNFVHDHVAKALVLIMSFMFIRYDIKVTSAGEWNSADFGADCYGKSDSIGVKSDPVEDKRLIMMNDYGAGMM